MSHRCRLKEALERRAMTQDQLARAVGKRLNAINPVVNGRRLPKLELALAIARAVGWRVEELWPAR